MSGLDLETGWIHVKDGEHSNHLRNVIMKYNYKVHGDINNSDWYEN